MIGSYLVLPASNAAVQLCAQMVRLSFVVADNGSNNFLFKVRYHLEKAVGGRCLLLCKFFHPKFLLDSFVLAATDHLRQKISKLEARMRSLEDAIAIVHDSNDTHPLLVSIGIEDEEAGGEGDPMLKPLAEEPETHTAIDASGMLYLDGQGASCFFGPSGGSEVCRICYWAVSYLTYISVIHVESVIGECASILLVGLTDLELYARKRRI